MAALPSSAGITSKNITKYLMLGLTDAWRLDITAGTYQVLTALSKG
jgi:hypothetical protein